MPAARTASTTVGGRDAYRRRLPAFALTLHRLLFGLIVFGGSARPYNQYVISQRVEFGPFTTTVRDLIVGSDISLADQGTHHLKGVESPWELFEVRLGAA